MKTFLIFYDSAPEDLGLAKGVSQVIEDVDFKLWLADHHVTHNWRIEVDQIARSSDCAGAIAFWSSTSRENGIVCAEAELVAKLQLPLLGILFNGVEDAPLGLANGPRLRFDSTERQASFAERPHLTGPI